VLRVPERPGAYEKRRRPGSRGRRRQDARRALPSPGPGTRPPRGAKSAAD
jgi:hypothetical protein